MLAASHDIDLLISLGDPEALRIKLASMDGHFVLCGHSLYYVQASRMTGKNRSLPYIT